MNEIALKSYAKINLSLRILGLREDRFHELDSLMQSVSLHDNIFLEIQNKAVSITCNSPDIPQGENNIVYKAARKFFEFTKIDKGVNFHIEKSVPMAAGLAGGSGNAAAALIGLNTLYNANLSNSHLVTLGAEIGSDVPFCLIGGRCRVRGRGELVEQQRITPTMHFILVVPKLEISTKWAYEEFDRWKMKTDGTLKPKYLDARIEAVQNDFEKAIINKHPEIKNIKEQLLTAGAVAASMSGSGPSVFGIAKDEDGAENIFNKLKNKHENIYKINSVNYGVAAS